MALAPGTRIGPYEIVAPIGAGGMGEVYRARDPRLGRDVAIKVLPDAFTSDRDRLERFEREARLLAALNHPNVAAIYGMEQAGDLRGLVLELIEGPTLAERVAAGPLTFAESTGIARQLIDAVDAAHERGVIHRDLKPANIKITPDGQVKVLDFGLAKALETADGGRPFDGAQGRQTADEVSHSPTMTSAGTRHGVILGTAAYMSPEQTRGAMLDKRTDIWSFGCVWYEMLTGRSAFAGATVSDSIVSILTKEPDWPALPAATPSNIRRLLARCLEKDPKKRLRDIGDARVELDEAPPASSVATPVAAANQPTRRFGLLMAAALLMAALAGVAGAWLFRGSTAESAPPTFKRLTFRRGTIGSARFAPDGQSLVYAAAWQGERSQLFSGRTDSSESRQLGVTGAAILSISAAGEMALRLPNGTLARAPLAGGAPREVAEGVASAAWGPDGRELAMVRLVSGRRQLEFPPGHVLYETANLLANVSVSKDGQFVACSESTPGVGAGGSSPSLIVVDLAGKKRTLSSDWNSIRGISWPPGRNEVWFAASKTGFGGRSLLAVTLDGMQRELVSGPVNFVLHDISTNGRVLLEQSDERFEASGLTPGDVRERDLSWFDATGLSDLSPDGRTLIITESGESGFRVFLRRTDGSQTAQLADGGGFALSPDGRWVILQSLDPPKLSLLPTGPGDIKLIPNEHFAGYTWANWFPDGKRILIVGSEPDRRNRLYVQDLDGGAPRPISAEGTSIQTGSDAISPNGEWVAALGPNRVPALYPTDGGDVRPLSGVVPGDLPSRWSSDGRFLYLFRQGVLPAPIYRLEVQTGKKELWKEVGPSDRAGVNSIGHFQITPDGAYYAYNFLRSLSDLYVVDGLK